MQARSRIDACQVRMLMQLTWCTLRGSGPIRILSPSNGRSSRSRHRSFCIALVLLCAVLSYAKDHKDDLPPYVLPLQAAPADVFKAVEQVTQDQIIHGTYSYEKERILYGAHSAKSAHVFGEWKGQGKAYYKVADKVLSPRFFKDSEDIGTISVRYIVEQVADDSVTVQIDAVFVDARNVHHPSLGNVESAEFTAIRDHVNTIQAAREEEHQRAAEAAYSKPAPVAAPSESPLISQSVGTASQPSESVPDLQKEVAALRRQVELRVKDQGAQLKSAPFHSAATLESVPGQSEVVVVILTAYWYGVETEDGHRGWIHRSQLEPLP